MPKQFYQADVAESDTDSIWTGSIYYTETVEEAEFLTMLELQQDWGDGYIPQDFIDTFGSEMDGENQTFPGVEEWNLRGYWDDLDVTTGMLTLPPIEALAQLGKLYFNISDEEIEQVMTDDRTLSVQLNPL